MIHLVVSIAALVIACGALAYAIHCLRQVRRYAAETRRNLERAAEARRETDAILRGIGKGRLR